MTITLDEPLASRLRAVAGARGEDPSHFAVAAIAERLAVEEDPDADLTAEERTARDAGIARGDADFAARRFRSLEEVKADKRARFGLPV